jgi:hypothetical protein
LFIFGIVATNAITQHKVRLLESIRVVKGNSTDDSFTNLADSHIQVAAGFYY